MWAGYFSYRPGFSSFNSVIHLVRSLYHAPLFARRVTRLGGPAASYLEIGVGSGETLGHLRGASGAECCGIDKSQLACRLARTKAQGCQIVGADGLSLPFRDATFDAAHSLGLLEHFRAIQQRRLLREHARVARKVACSISRLAILICYYYRGPTGPHRGSTGPSGAGPACGPSRSFQKLLASRQVPRSAFSSPPRHSRRCDDLPVHPEV
ncbi:MAG: class I SAM-dependent methyltransferase [Isosphaeraceae bacterium]